jgi:hypothetical protein
MVRDRQCAAQVCVSGEGRGGLPAPRAVLSDRIALGVAAGSIAHEELYFDGKPSRTRSPTPPGYVRSRPDHFDQCEVRRLPQSPDRNAIALGTVAGELFLIDRPFHISVWRPSDGEHEGITCLAFEDDVTLLTCHTNGRVMRTQVRD